MSAPSIPIYTKESLISKLNEIRELGFVPSVRGESDAGVGDTLEHLLGIATNNLPLPNAGEWELKAQVVAVGKRNSQSLTTLLHKEPSPTGLSLIPQKLVPVYGWPHKEAGKGKYSPNELSLRVTLRSTGTPTRGFSLVFESDGPNEEKIAIHFDSKSVLSCDKEWLKTVLARGGEYLEPVPYWGINDLYCALGAKLKNCFYAKAVKKRIDGIVHFHYTDFFKLAHFSKDKLIAAIKSGDLYVDVDARTGKNHGTKIRARPEVFMRLYEVCEIVDK